MPIKELIGERFDMKHVIRFEPLQRTHTLMHIDRLCKNVVFTGSSLINIFQLVCSPIHLRACVVTIPNY